jgi:calcineurin-like phosphoesterase family protein
LDSKRGIAVNKWSASLRLQDLATAEACGVPPDFWLIADTHFGDPDIDGYTGRPADAEGRILASWRSLVADDEVVVHLGDLRGERLERPDRLAPLLSALPGRLLLLLGDHDCPGPEPYARLGIGLIPPFALRRGDWTVAFTHVPHLELINPALRLVDAKGMFTVEGREARDVAPGADAPPMPPRSRRLNVHGHLHAPAAPDLRLVNACVEWTGYAPVRAGALIDARISALARAPWAFASPLPYDAWLAREHGGPVQLSDLTRFPDAPSRAAARAAYERYRRAVLDAALRAGSGATSEG